MPDHKHIRPYTEPLRRAGAQNVGELPIRDPVQTVAIMDDFRRVVRPLETPVVFVHQFITAGVALRAAMQVHVLANGGTYFYAVQASDGDDMFWFVRDVELGGLGAEVVPSRATASVGGEGTPQNTVAVGDTVDLFPSPQGGLFLTGSVHELHPRVYVPRGLFFCAMRETTNSNTRLGVMYQEIPGRSDVPVA